MTRVLRVPPEGAAGGDEGYAEALAEAAAVLRRGGLVAFPTETVYGLGAIALDPEAARRVFEAKGRPADNPLIVHVTGVEQARAVTGAWPDAARRAAEAFWPGPLTLVLPRHRSIPDIVTAGLHTVAVRCPAHPVALDLIAATGAPLVAPSANRSGRPSPTSAEHVLEDLWGRVDVVIDAGPCPIGVESTVVDVTTVPPALLRPGGVTLERLRAVLGDVEPAAERAEGAPRSPGLKYAHYAPSARLVVIEAGEPRELAETARSRAAVELAAGRRPGFLLPTELTGCGWPGPVVAAGAWDDPAAFAALLFAGLRALDGLGVDTIIAFLPREEGMGSAVRNRLLKAADERLGPARRGPAGGRAR